jgi:ABC-type antimicrobial peptide transport system permease subunit
MTVISDLLSPAWLVASRDGLWSLLAIAGFAVGVYALTSIISVGQARRAAMARFSAKMDLMRMGTAADVTIRRRPSDTKEEEGE